MYCEKCFKAFNDCTCFTGKDRVQQYIDLIRKEMLIIENIVLRHQNYSFRVAGKIIKTTIDEMTDHPLQITIVGNLDCSDINNLDDVYMREAELLDEDGNVVIKYLYNHPIYIPNYLMPGDILMLYWTFGQ